MNQQVDLLVPELRPKREHLTLRQLLAAWGGFAALLLVISSWEGIGAWQLAGEQAVMQAQWETLSSANEALRASVRSTAEPELVRQVEELRQRFENQALMVNAVEDYEQASDGGFSRYMRDLAARHVSGMALSHIELHDGGAHIQLSGETMTPVNVPVFLKRLSEGESFRGHRFDEFRLEVQENGLLRFDIIGPARERRG